MRQYRDGEKRVVEETVGDALERCGCEFTEKDDERIVRLPKLEEKDFHTPY